MFCKNCGTNLPEGSEFCPNCGNTPEATTVSSFSVIPSGVHCPECQSRNLQVSTENNTTATGGQYSGSKGCLGFLLFGPLGLLCGSCGKKLKISTTNKTFWVCQDCGNKFRNTQEVMEEKKKEMKNNFAASIVMPILPLPLIIFSFLARADGDAETANIAFFAGLFMLAVAGLTIPLFIKSKKEYEQAKAEHEKYVRNSKNDGQ